ncbi:MAG: hypothetical protein RLO17_10910 [Cyclobacteriaceae bacterium]
MITARWLLLLIPLLISACCFDGLDCCNPDLSKLEFPELLGDYFPSEIGDTFVYYSPEDSLVGVVEKKAIIDTMFAGPGDECPMRPGEYFEFSVILDNRFEFSARTFFASEALVATLGSIETPINNYYPDSVATSNWGGIYQKDYIKSEILDTIWIEGKYYEDVIQGISTIGDFQQMYISKNIGLVAFEFRQVCYYLKQDS